MQTKFVGYETLKRSVSMAQLLDRYGLLDRLHRSGDTLSGACPLHDGHNPSQFRVSLSKNCFICFGDCQGGGSVIDFVSRKEHIGIREAALRLQEWFCVTGNGKRETHPTPPRVEAPSLEYNEPLKFTLPNLDPRHPYLVGRGLSPSAIRTFGLGYCRHGLLAGRIAIPIHDAEGRLVGPGGRVLLLFDEDEAGRRGASEACRRLEELLTVRVVQLGSEGAQPDHQPLERLREVLDIN